MTDASFGILETVTIPNIVIRGGKDCPALGIGPSETLSAAKSAIARAIRLGYRHFQPPASLEKQIGEAIAESPQSRFVRSRNRFFITYKLQFLSSTSQFITTNLMQSLQTMNLEYVDLLLIEYPEQQNDDNFSITELLPAWEAMEQCMSLGLTKLIGVGNFSSKMLQSLIHLGKTIPSVNSVGMREMWRNPELREFCSANDITIFVSAKLDGTNEDFDYTQFMESQIFQQIEKDLLKTPAEIYFRWAYEQGAALLLDTLNEVEMRNIRNTFGWEIPKQM